MCGFSTDTVIIYDYRSLIELLVNKGLEMMWQEAVTDHLSVLRRYLTETSEGSLQDFGQNSSFFLRYFICWSVFTTDASWAQL
jgi:hypothetical protein